MAKKKRKRQNRRKSQPLIKSWLLLSSGMLIGLFVALLVFLNYQRPETPTLAAETTDTAIVRPGNRNKPIEVQEIASKYDFYGALPSSRVVVPESDNRSNSKTIVIQDEKEYSAEYNSYTIQVGSFKKAAGADQQKASLAILGYEPEIEKTRLHDGSIVHRVLLGPFADLNAVNQTRTRLHSQKIENTILKSE